MTNEQYFPVNEVTEDSVVPCLAASVLPRKGMDVIDSHTKVRGVITLVHNEEFCVSWSNGMVGSFRNWLTAYASGVRKA